MKRVFCVVAVLLLAVSAYAIPAHSTYINASSIMDANGNLLASGNLCVVGVNKGVPLNYQAGGTGQVTTRPACITVTNGAIPVNALYVPDSAYTQPANVGYTITVTDKTSGKVVIQYVGVAITGTTFSFDTYVPTGVSLPVLYSYSGPLPSPSPSTLGGVYSNDCSVLGPAYVVQKINTDGSETCIMVGGGSSIWGLIGGTLSSQTDLQAALNARELALGNPSTNGYILSSTTAGVRSWVPNSGSYTLPAAAPAALGGVYSKDCSALGSTYVVQKINTDGSETCVLVAVGSAAWGSISGTLSSQTDLVSALNAKENTLGNPSVSGYILSSTTGGVRSWIAAPTAGVSSFNGRTGAVTPQSGDYSYSQIASTPTIPSASSSTPNMDGTGAAGSSTNYARADHVHPSDSSREPALGNPSTNGYVLSSTTGGVRSWVASGTGTPGGTSGSVQVNNGTGGFGGWTDYTPGTDTFNITNLNVSGTFGTGNAQAKGQGIYLFSGHREDTQCLQLFASNDGITVKPLFPFGAPNSCLFSGSGSDTAVRDPQLFFAPWNKTYYIAYTPGLNNSRTEYFGLASSPDLVNWSGMSPVATVITSPGASTSNEETWAPAWFMDNSANCAAQNYTCLHIFIAIAYDGVNAHFTYFETHPTNSSLTAWSTPVALTGAPTSAYSYDPAVTAVGSTYYALFMNSDDRYHLYSSSSLLTGWTDGGAISAFNCVTNAAGYCEAAAWAQSDTSTLRVYFHDTGTGGLIYYAETGTSSITNTSFGGQTAVSGTNQFLINHLMPLRTSDFTTLSNVAARSYQQATPLFTPYGGTSCGDAALFSNTSGGIYTGNCWGVELVAATQNPGDAYDALHLVGSSSSNSEAQHVDIGNYTGVNLGSAVNDVLTRGGCGANCGNGGVLGTMWSQSTSLAVNIGGSGVYGGSGGTNSTIYKGVAFYVGAFAPAQSAQANCLNYGTSTSCGVGVRLSGSGTTLNGYVGYYNDSTGKMVISKIVNGAETVLSNVTATGATYPSPILLTASGSTLTLYSNATTLQTTATDSTFIYGAPGVYTAGSSSGQGANTFIGTGWASAPVGTGWVNWAKVSPTNSQFAGNRKYVTANFTTSSTSLVVITGLTWTFAVPPVGSTFTQDTVHSFACHLSYSQSTAAAANAFGVQASTTAPTNLYARMHVDTSLSNAGVNATLPTLTTTTATNIGTFTPSAFGAIGTVADIFTADIHGTLEQGAGATTLNIMALSGSGSDALTIYRGSYCELEP